LKIRLLLSASAIVPGPGDAPGAMAFFQCAELRLELETNPGMSSPHKPVFTESSQIDAQNSG
jgi:hypothetical protein